MARNSVIKVSVIGDVENLRKAFSETATGAEKWSSRMKGAGTALTAGLTAPIVAGAALSIKAASEEASQMELLADVIRKRIPQATDEMIASNEEWVSNLQRNIAVADGDIRDMEQSFIAAGMSVEEAQKNTALAYDIAAQTGKEATTVSQALIKANNGQVTALGRLGIEVKDAAGETKSFDEIQQDLADTMGGAAADAADTSAGRAERLQLTMADLAETFGTILLPLFEKLVGWLQQVADWFSNLSPAGQKIALAIAGVAAAIGPLLIVGAKLVESFKVIQGAWSVLSKAFMANPWLLLIAAIIALVVLIITNWDTIKKFLLQTWEQIKTAARVTWDWIKNTIRAVVNFIVQLFLNWTLPGLIMKHWTTIKKGLETFKGWIVGIWNSIVSFFTQLPARISSAVSGMWDGIKSSFRAAVNWIIDKWNGLEISIGGGSILGVDIPKITVRTPNIPRFHDGGVFTAPGGAREGLALLRTGEIVIPAGARAAGSNVYNIVVNAGLGANGQQIGRAIVEELQRYERSNGPIPIATRAS